MILDSERQRELLVAMMEETPSVGRRGRRELTALEDAVMAATVLDAEATDIDGDAGAANADALDPVEEETAGAGPS